MKKTTIFYSTVLVSCIAILFSACNDSDLNQFQEINNTNNTRAEIPEFLSITYNGKTFKNVPTTYDENGDFIFMDKEFASIYKSELANDSCISINIKSETEISFYKDLKTNLESNGYNYDEFTKNIDYQSYRLNKDTRVGYGNLATLELFDDERFSDTSKTFHLDKDVIFVTERRMHYIDFNDKCSSLKVTNNLPNDPNETIVLGEYEYACSNVDAVFLGYEDKDYKKKSITYIATPGTVREAASLPGFNDKMSSFRFLFAQKNQYFEQ